MKGKYPGTDGSVKQAGLTYADVGDKSQRRGNRRKEGREEGRADRDPGR